MTKQTGKNFLIIAVLVFLTVAAYSDIRNHEFLVNWDDPVYVTENPAIFGFKVDNISLAFQRAYLGNFAPVQIVSYMMDYEIWGLRASGFLFMNVFFHLLNGSLFYFLLTRLGWKCLSAFVAACIFLIHPVQVESVAWISERKNLLGMLFFLLAFHCYMSFTDSRRMQRSGTIPLLASYMAFVLALLSKAVVTVFPLVLILFDICFAKKSEKPFSWRDKIPYFVLSIVITAVTISLQHRDEGVFSYHGGSPYNTLLTMLPILTSYVSMLFWPVDLSVLYFPEIKTGFDTSVLVGLLLLVLEVAVGVLLFRRLRHLFFWYILFFIGLLPVIQIIPMVTLIQDRYLYFPLLGAAAFFSGVSEKISSPFRRRAFTGLLLLLLPVLSVLTYNRVLVWQNSETLWLDATRKQPAKAEVWTNLGVAFQQSGHNDNAIISYRRALSLAPLNMMSLHNLGMVLMDARDYGGAREILTKLLRLNPESPDAWSALATSHLFLGDIEAAENACRKALGHEPASVQNWMLLGDIYMKKKMYHEARAAITKAATFEIKNPEIEYRLAVVEANLGNTTAVFKHLRSALDNGLPNPERLQTDLSLDGIRNDVRMLEIIKNR